MDKEKVFCRSTINAFEKKQLNDAISKALEKLIIQFIFASTVKSVSILLLIITEYCSVSHDHFFAEQKQQHSRRRKFYYKYKLF